MKTLVLYYSHTGNNRFAAERISEGLGAEIEEIRPVVGGFSLLLLASGLKAGFGNRKLKSDPSAFERIVLVGPIWMGQIVWPLRSLIKRHGASLNSVAFVTACGGGDEIKSDPFGYETVFEKFRALLGPKFIGGFAVPVGLASDAGAGADVMKVRLSAETCAGPIAARLDSVVDALREQ